MGKNELILAATPFVILSESRRIADYNCEIRNELILADHELTCGHELQSGIALWMVLILSITICEANSFTPQHPK